MTTIVPSYNKRIFKSQEIAKCKICGKEVMVMKYLDLQEGKWKYFGEPICDYCSYLQSQNNKESRKLHNY